FINNTVDTGSFGTDTLVVSSLPAAPSSCASQSTLATWTMPTSGQGSGGPPPPFTTKATDVSTATTTSSGGTTTVVTTGGVTTDQWKITGGWDVVPDPPASTQTPYFQFAVDSSNYGDVVIQFSYDLEGSGNWASPGNNKYFIH